MRNQRRHKRFFRRLETEFFGEEKTYRAISGQRSFCQRNSLFHPALGGPKTALSLPEHALGPAQRALDGQGPRARVFDDEGPLASGAAQVAF